MATVGNTASMQLLMARATTNYSYKTGDSTSAAKRANSALSSLGKTETSSAKSVQSAAQKKLDTLLKTTLKRKDSVFREQYTELFKKVYGLTDKTAQAADSTSSLKISAADTRSAADSLTAYAKKLEYGGEYSAEEYTKLAEKFADSYNSMIEGAADSDSRNVLQKGVIMVNTAKAYSNSLARAGFTLGSDNKLTFNKDKLSGVSATDIKTTFGSYGFSQKAAQKAAQINTAAGSAGALTYTNARMTNYAYSIGALFSNYA